MALRVSIASVLLAVLAAPASAAPCSVVASGADSPEWRAATASLAELALSDRDCTLLRIEIAGDRALVLFTTPDGRSAERIVKTASDLRPTINALRVQGPAAVEPQPEPQPAPQKPAPAAPKPAPAEPPNPTDLRLALLTGIRGGADSLTSPLLIGEVALGFGRFELGASLAAEVQYFAVNDTRSPDRQSGAAALALSAGIRQPTGSFDFRAGARAAYALLLTVNHESQSCPIGMVCPFLGEDERASEGRLGVYTGFAVPRASTLRFRTDVAFDVALPPPDSEALPLTPGWALSLLLGLEVAP